ncbi:hypothetical protein TREMEDRAFT_71381 [Tremella mesenterica DSM 1558]|uniref:uncharacterized protein n=1 Tax=Tremella mesenterica (strain ATCC 24925 / CBS 8224 / DSM 1558 / NBRC 9311 / NRRL Y-6157 / RJB 2259-6 / UBC 559-6) TaxID=578456 RepID=UPI0003F4A06C|nr:uncharacterized protein TREMEDRAFT_71381 [Tremella mesenterica DSM 1558]EIW70777.1 hypothetical protein TREMEDRAFT_71381 [Tremella mesenterica DSM 1558]
MPSPPPQPVPTNNPHAAFKHPQNINTSPRTGMSPMSYGAMTGISFTGAAFSMEKSSAGVGIPVRSLKMSGVVGGVAGSYGARFYSGAVGSPPAPFSTSITMVDPSSISRRSYAAAVQNRNSDYPMNALSSSFNSLSMHAMSTSLGTSYTRGQVHSLLAARSDAELTKEYMCCTQRFAGLHDLLEHVEDMHPLGGEIDNQNNHFFSMDMDMEELDEKPLIERTTSLAGSSMTSESRSSEIIPTYPVPISKPTTPTSEFPVPVPVTGNSFQISDVLTSPLEVHVPSAPLSRVSTNTSSPADGSVVTPNTSGQASPVFPKMAPGRSAFFPIAKQPINHKRHFDRAFNDVVSGKAASPKTNTEDGQTLKLPRAVAPTVLHGSGPSTSDTPGQGTNTSGNGENKSTDSPLPQPSLFSTDKPWRCPNPGCNKSYRQSNGLKYHREKGQCDFAIHDAVDLGLTFEEAERRNKPFVCAVGNGCTKRYRQMNGLKYHYLNSGAHGAWGLRLLENGTHPAPINPISTPSTPISSSSTPKPLPSLKVKLPLDPVH